jgi:hypothetical protein
MVALLAVEKRRLIAANGAVTRQDFEAAWDRCWHVMVLERAWAHATRFRRGSRMAMLSTKPEFRAAFLDEPTAFAFAVERLTMAASNMCLELGTAQVPFALISAIGYAPTPTERVEAVAA